MHSAHAANPETEPTGSGDMRRLRRRGKIATGIGGAGFITTLIVAIGDTDTRDNDIITGVEIGFAAVAVAGFLVAFTIWVITECAAVTRLLSSVQERAASSIDFANLHIGGGAPTNAASITARRRDPRQDMTS